jgi:hypothetical protein
MRSFQLCHYPLHLFASIHQERRCHAMGILLCWFGSLLDSTSYWWHVLLSPTSIWIFEGTNTSFPALTVEGNTKILGSRAGWVILRTESTHRKGVMSFQRITKGWCRTEGITLSKGLQQNLNWAWTYWQWDRFHSDNNSRQNKRCSC